MMANYNIRPGPGRLTGAPGEWITRANIEERTEVQFILSEIRKRGRAAPRILVDRLTVIRNRCVKRNRPDPSPPSSLDIAMADGGGWELIGADGRLRWYRSYAEARVALMRSNGASVPAQRKRA